jgi:phosphatidylethanolamine N-methyltransferase
MTIPRNVFEVTKWIISLALFFSLFYDVPKEFYVAFFIFWRLAYNVGLGYLLHLQSQSRWFSRQFQGRVPGWLDRLTQSCMPSNCPKPKAMPHEFRSWMVFRGLTEVILAGMHILCE